MDVANQLPVTLLVEEEPQLENGMIDLLNHHQFSVLTSPSCAEAVEIAKKRKVDLFVVLGVRPNQNALDFVCNFRKEKQTKNIPLILLSSFYRSPRMEEVVESLPKTKYLITPISNQDLLDTFHEVLGMDSAS